MKNEWTSTLEAMRANITEKQEFIDALLEKNERIETENEGLRETLRIHNQLFENGKIGG